MSGASGHGEEPMADPCVNARRTRRITARQSHLPKIRVRPLKVKKSQCSLPRTASFALVIFVSGCKDCEVGVRANSCAAAARS
jgi:hypothetical protein